VTRVSELEPHARLAEQAAKLEELRADISRLTGVISDRDSELERALDQLAATDSPGHNADEIGYRRMVQRLRRLVREHVRQGRRAAVVSGGDEALLQHAGCGAVHLSQDRFGGYAGRLPESGRSAIAQLEAARSQGVGVLVLPDSNQWWLQQYVDFARYLERRYKLAIAEGGAGSLWDLEEASPLRELDDLISGLRASSHQPAILDWQTECDLAALLGECNVFAPEQHDATLPYLDQTIDVVALGDPTPERLAEARRVAAAAVVAAGLRRGEPRFEIVWRSDDRKDRAADVSVVVACRDRQGPSPAFLRQVRETLPRELETEVLLPNGDDAPTDVRNDVRPIRCRDEVWGRSLRRAVDAASGELIVVIGGELWPAAGWLSPLVHLLRHWAGAGVVTGLLVTPDGRVPVNPASRNGDGGPYGADPGAVEHSYVQPVEAASRELFATNRQLLLDHSRRWRDCAEPVAPYSAAVAAEGMAVLRQPETLAVKPWPGAGEVR
jgi:hypothetical protein